MKREGRQHGMVSTYQSPLMNSQQDRSRRMEKQPTAGTFTRVPQKPTNHSKYTSRCPRPRCSCCHTFPASKAMDKTKGTHKLRSCDVVTNYRLVSWRVVDSRSGFKLSGFSASGILDHLDYYDDQVYDDEYEESDGSTRQPDKVIEHIIEEIDDSPSGSGGDCDYNRKEEEVDDEISYCNVGIVWEQVDGGDEEGWCLVQEL